MSHSKGGVLYDSRDPQCTFVHFPFSNMVLFHELSPVNILQTRNHRFVVLPSSVMSIIRHKGRVHSKKKVKYFLNLGPDAPFLIPTNTARKYFHQLEKLIKVHCKCLAA